MASQLPIRLRCESRESPLGIGRPQPRLSWWLDDGRRGAAQSGYHVLIAGSLAELERDRGDLWDSGRVSSDQSTHVAYAGRPLRSRQRCHWKVRTWDQHHQPSPWSAPAAWEMGLLQPSDWSAQWIGSSIVGGPYSIPPAPYLRKQFSLPSKPAAARLYVTVLGLYEFEVNGQPASDCVFAPGRTEYRHRVPYHVFDVTHLLTAGDNACGAVLGDGWYCGHLHSDPRQTYGDRPRLLAQLEISLSDGATITIATDSTWRAGEGPIRSSDLLMGEDYDARREIPGWSRPGFDDGGWQPATRFDDPGIALVAAVSPPVRRQETLRPISAPSVSANRRRHLFDLGQNMVGRVRLRIRNAPPGQTIDLRYVEMLDKDGKPYTAALRTARATDHYTTRGGDEEWYEPHFTFHGFRYVEVRDYPGRNPTPDDLVGVVLHSDTEPTGEFTCSDPLINQLQSNIRWSQKGNFIDIPTDCPQRDERLGWTGDAQVFCRTAAFNMDVQGFFEKWLQDMADAQGADGRIPSVVPHVKSIHNEGGPAWADAAVICPWVIYQCYGDATILADRWPMMTRFMDFLRDTTRDLIRADETCKWRGYGDWLDQDAYTPPDLIGTAFYAYSAGLMAQIATVLGRDGDAERYRTLAARVRQAFLDRFVTPDGLLVAQTQTAAVLALHFDLLPETRRARVFDFLVRNIRQRGMHLSTGFVGTPYLNPVLTRFGRPDVAYALLMQKTFPSWLFPVTHAATTMWERWDGWTPEKGFNDAGMNSYNHYAYGAVGEWMYATVAGIDLDPQQPGYKCIVIRPQPGGGLTAARASLLSPFGRIESDWRIDAGRIRLAVSIPPNTTATVQVPTADPATITEGGRAITAASGLTAVDTAFFRAVAGRYVLEADAPLPATS
jgi:alpha-L-rhamnosidase